jgi:hypothetical protein
MPFFVAETAVRRRAWVLARCFGCLREDHAVLDRVLSVSPISLPISSNSLELDGLIL